VKTCGGSGGITLPFLTSALDDGEWSASRLGHFTPRERAPSTDWIGGWVSPREGLDALEKRKIEPGPSSLSLYRLRYPDSWYGTAGLHRRRDTPVVDQNGERMLVALVERYQLFSHFLSALGTVAFSRMALVRGVCKPEGTHTHTHTHVYHGTDGQN
jgi:hypothetical protein